MKKIIASIITMMILCTSFITVGASSKTPPSVTANGMVLMDGATGKVLHSKNADTAFPPASTTKIMTALLALENTNPSDIVTVGAKPPFADGSKIYLYEDEEITVRDLLFALLIASGNDCAEALAEHIGGSIEGFAIMMNKRAKELGATNTNFVNPSGLYDENHKTSARDLALIMREVIKHPLYNEISTTQVHTIKPTNKCEETRYLHNRNRIAVPSDKMFYDGIIGGKTGWTSKALFSYVAASERDGQTLIVALVHDENKTYLQDTVNLFDYGYENFELRKLFSKNEEVTTFTMDDDKTIPLLASDDFYYVVNKGSSEIPNYTLPEEGITLEAFDEGDVVLEASIFNNSSLLGTIELISGSNYAVTPPRLSSDMLSEAGAGILKFLFRVFVITFFLFILALIIRARNLRRRRLRKRSRYYTGRRM
jgi:serine-type D-Ala-D-Ala carboxypeptidase (penicillin-binding protein 5/6)